MQLTAHQLEVAARELCRLRGEDPDTDERAWVHDFGALLTWAVERWFAEVSQRPMVNVHRRSLDDTWRQVIRKLGGDDIVMCGPRHDELRAAISSREWDAMKAAPEPSDGWTEYHALRKRIAVLADELQEAALSCIELNANEVDVLKLRVAELRQLLRPDLSSVASVSTPQPDPVSKFNLYTSPIIGPAREGVTYRGADPVMLGAYYTRHVEAMTREGLHAKSDIAEELAWRDKRIDALIAERDGLKIQCEAWRMTAKAAGARATLACGHNAELGVVSAETGEWLYCELCDAKSARNDAEKMEAEWRARAERAGAALRELIQVSENAHKVLQSVYPQRRKQLGPIATHVQSASWQLRAAIGAARQQEKG